MDVAGVTCVGLDPARGVPAPPGALCRARRCAPCEQVRSRLEPGAGRGGRRLGRAWSCWASRSGPPTRSAGRSTRSTARELLGLDDPAGRRPGLLLTAGCALAVLVLRDRPAARPGPHPGPVAAGHRPVRGADAGRHRARRHVAGPPALGDHGGPARRRGGAVGRRAGRVAGRAGPATAPCWTRCCPGSRSWPASAWSRSGSPGWPTRLLRLGSWAALVGSPTAGWCWPRPDAWCCWPGWAGWPGSGCRPAGCRCCGGPGSRSR